MSKKKNKKQEKSLLGTWMFFPTIVYNIINRDFLDSSQTVAKEFIDKIEKKDNLKHHLYQSDNIFNDTRISELTVYIAETAWNILAAQGYKMEGKATTYTEMWAQEIEPDSFMPQHIHGHGNQISGFYFLDCPKDCLKVVVHDPRPGKNQINLEEADDTQATYGSSMCNFTPEPGLMVLFNSWLPHSFTVNSSDKSCTLIHFNIKVIDNPPVLVPTSSAIVV